MKIRFFSILLIALLAISLIGCDSDNIVSPDDSAATKLDRQAAAGDPYPPSIDLSLGLYGTDASGIITPQTTPALTNVSAIQQANKSWDNYSVILTLVGRNYTLSLGNYGVSATNVSRSVSGNHSVIVGSNQTVTLHHTLSSYPYYLYPTGSVFAGTGMD